MTRSVKWQACSTNGTPRKVLNLKLYQLKNNTQLLQVQLSKQKQKRFFTHKNPILCKKFSRNDTKSFNYWRKIYILWGRGMHLIKIQSQIKWSTISIGIRIQLWWWYWFRSSLYEYTQFGSELQPRLGSWSEALRRFIKIRFSLVLNKDYALNRKKIWLTFYSLILSLQLYR